MTVYLIHFETHYKHSQHYIGYADNLSRRVDHHRNGTGARLMQVVTQAGIDWTVVRTWEGKGKTFERQLKNQKHAARLCPICNPDGWSNRMVEAATCNCNEDIPF